MEIQVERFYYELLKTCLAESPKGNKIGMGFALSRYSFHLGFFGAAAESESRVDRSNIDRNQRKQQYHSSLDWVDVGEGDDLA